MDFNRIKDSYELIDEHYINDLNSNSLLLRHRKTGARVSILENDDDNKVFYIGFRTPPKDSTGVAHIIEHTVLCGSDKYPCKDPFVELAKGSLNTFLNAMTYPDKTVYPVASCNDKDFKNLMDVYLDAVFHPNIYKEEKIFMQEGWHYELTDKDSPLQISGVVYNEMKGEFSSPDSVVSRQTLNSLFPDTTYGVESGGDPECIPDLTYENFLDFHRNYYHPSNSYIYLYGDADMAERLEYIDKEYLSKYEKIEVDSFPGVQKPFDKMKESVVFYPITDNEKTADNTYLTLNFVVDKSVNKLLYIAFQIIDYALSSSQGTPVRKALVQKGIGKDVYSYYDNGMLQPYFSIVAQNANESDKDEFIKTVFDTVKEVVEKGFDKDALIAGINSLEFRYRESDYGRKPKGLCIGLNALDTWLYDDNMAFDAVTLNDTFNELRSKINTDYFEKLLEKYILNNKHASFLMVVPKNGLTLENEKKLQDKLAEYKNSLTEEEIASIVDNTVALNNYQETPDRPEDIAKIPLLKREDLSQDVRPLKTEELVIGSNKVLVHDYYTNEIIYASLIFKRDTVPVSKLPYVTLLTQLLGSINTDNYDYEKIGYEIDKYTGSIDFVAGLLHRYNENTAYGYTIRVPFKTFKNNVNKAMSLIAEIIKSSHFDDYERLLEIINQVKSGYESMFSYATHNLAIQVASSYLSEVGYLDNIMKGVDYYRFLSDIADNFEERKEEVVANIKEIFYYFFNENNLIIDVTGRKDELDSLMSSIDILREALPDKDISFEKEEIKLAKTKAAFTTSAQVDYVCQVGNFLSKGFKYTGALCVLKTIMSYEYLWSEVRVKGGAYGCMCNFARTGMSYFVSYRDPNLEKTLEVYDKADKYISEFDADENKMTKFIIGTISEMDMLLTASGLGDRSRIAYFSGLNEEIFKRDRNEVLKCTAEDIRALAKYIRSFLDDEILVVIGNENLIKESKDRFDKIESLLN